MALSDVLARRFLHVNLNCKSLDATEALYVKQLGLSARMRSDPDAPSDGRILGLQGETRAATSFLYDARGGRNACALEAIQWTTPGLKPDPNPDPARPGIRSALFTVGDLDTYVGGLRGAGFAVSDPLTGLISGGKSVLVMDPDGVVIELTEMPADLPTALFAGIRLSVIDVAATVDFLTAIGFMVLQAPAGMAVAGDQLAPGCGGTQAQCVVARLALPEDRHQFTISVVQHPAAVTHPLPVGGNSQGLYRCALRVDNVERAVSSLPGSVELLGDPVWCPLPGTKIDGLYVAFMRSPDGVVFEFVERPLKYFTG
ncbi:VOC family protein [Mycobacterium branderi]|uniref:Glyoxalase n=1 Tax=Mycobacterium branderi TaxID=43348 RepID=A0A7I7WEE1_9MYCO|nr:VOC family protein [Mycobacterium branderi]MCV7231633.1 VOC family protein [Mycobacterium branderi]ORA40477.1 glyoxalase [Mycobacterium branderi]BBZ14883.1 hypothetical protein MBRA_50780 [Mycobacterium branderi]